MTNAEMPLFDLKATKSHVFCAGGGGSREYGKENGIVAVRKEPSCCEVGQIDSFYKTGDLIISIQIYNPTEDGNAASSQHMDFPEDSDGTQDSIDSSDGPNIAEQDTEDTGLRRPHVARGDIVSSGDEKDAVQERDLDKETFIAAIGDEFFYFLRFAGSFTLLSRIDKKIRMTALSSNLFLLRNHEVYGFYNVISNPCCVKIGPRAIKETENSTEEYLYRLVRRGYSIVPRNESGTGDIASNWESFFLHNGNIHKVVLDRGKSVFVFENERYEIEGKMSRIVPHDGSITFYSNTQEGGVLYFIGRSKRIYRLPKITTFGTNGEKVAVATCKGDAVIYSSGKYVSKVHISNVPVTGISVDDQGIFFSVLTGEVKSIRYKRHHIFTVVLAAVLILILGVLLAFLKRK